MKANLLLVSASDFPVHISDYLEKHGLTCFCSRGGIKTREVLRDEPIDAIVWLYLGNEAALAKDLLTIFNSQPDIPIVFVTQSYDELDFAEDIQGLFANLDLNDDLEDFLKNIELACNITPTVQSFPKPQNDTKAFPEIDFKNVVSHIIEQPKNEDTDATSEETRQNITTWHAVDQSEKDILSASMTATKKPLFKKVKSWLGK